MTSYSLAILFFFSKTNTFALSEVASYKLEKGPHRDYETGFCSTLAFMVLKKKIFKEFVVFTGFGRSMTLK
jgi:hypothetical protein